MSERMALIPLDEWLHLRHAIADILDPASSLEQRVVSVRGLRTSAARCDAGWLKLQPHLTDVANYMARG